jgi:hypothetical protein
MSMNICISGIRDICVICTGHIEQQRVYFDAWQTPTHVTHSILAMRDVSEQAVAYITWVRANTHTYSEDIYHDDDIMCETIIGTRMVDIGEDHAEQFAEWIDSVTTSGYTLEMSMS